jgi:quercetin dioxygenase-like cupin family protein
MNSVFKNLSSSSLKNNNYRKVIYTSPSHNLQLVLMCLNPSLDIGEESHDIDQFITITYGKGILYLDGKKTIIKAGDSFNISEGTVHNVINSSKTEKLKLYTIYTGKQHEDKLIQKFRPEND